MTRTRTKVYSGTRTRTRTRTRARTRTRSRTNCHLSPSSWPPLPSADPPSALGCQPGSPKTQSVQFDVPRSGQAEVRRPIYICAASQWSKPETRELAVFLRRRQHHLNGSWWRVWAALVENSAPPLAPAQTGSRLVGSGPTDGYTVFPPLPQHMRPSKQSVRGQPTQSTRRPRWSAPATGHCRRVCGGGVPPTSIGDS